MTAPNNKLPEVLEQHSYVPRNFTEAMQFCEFLAKSDFVPKAYKNQPGQIMACIQFGAERGIPPMQALQNIAVINGRPSMYGDLLLAMVQRTGLMTHHKEYFEQASNGATVAAVCEVRRLNEPIHVVKFSVEDAKRANLLGKPGPWQEYPKRMLMWRCRGFALRDKFADALGGMISREEAMDMPPSNDTDVVPDNTIEASSLPHESQHEASGPVGTNPVSASVNGSETAAVIVEGQDEEGPEDSGDASAAPLAGGDAPSVDAVSAVFKQSPKTPAEKFGIIKNIILDWDTRGGLEKLTPLERKAVMKALELTPKERQKMGEVLAQRPR